MLLHVQQLLQSTLRAQLARCLSTRALELLAARFLEDALPTASSAEKPAHTQPSPARSSHEALGEKADSRAHDSSQPAPPSPGAQLFKHVEAAYDLYDKFVIDILVLEAGIGITKFAENGESSSTSKVLCSTCRAISVFHC